MAAFTDDQTLIVRISMILWVAVTAGQSWSYRSLRAPEAFRTKIEARAWLAGNVFIRILVVANFLIASPALMLVIWIIIVTARRCGLHHLTAW